MRKEQNWMCSVHKTNLIKQRENLHKNLIKIKENEFYGCIYSTIFGTVTCRHARSRQKVENSQASKHAVIKGSKKNKLGKMEK